MPCSLFDSASSPSFQSSFLVDSLSGYREGQAPTLTLAPSVSLLALPQVIVPLARETLRQDHGRYIGHDNDNMLRPLVSASPPRSTLRSQEETRQRLLRTLQSVCDMIDDDCTASRPHPSTSLSCVAIDDDDNNNNNNNIDTSTLTTTTASQTRDKQ